MGKIVGRLAIAAAVGVGLVSLLYGAMRSWAAWRQGYSWSDMDWNGDGQTSLAEFFAASDIGRRDIERDGRSCTEYFALKDGREIRLACD